MAETVKGLRKLLEDLGELGKKTADLLDEVTENTAREVEEIAKSKASRHTDTGKLAQSIVRFQTPDQKGDIAWSVGARVPYAAYVEFGTGARVQVPEELRAEAAKFKGRGGSFKEGLENIRKWCRRKGIDEDAAYPIFMSILKNGLRPRPFLYPAYVSKKDDYIADVKAAIENLTKKI